MFVLIVLIFLLSLLFLFFSFDRKRSFAWVPSTFPLLGSCVILAIGDEASNLDYLRIRSETVFGLLSIYIALSYAFALHGYTKSQKLGQKMSSLQRLISYMCFGVLTIGVFTESLLIFFISTELLNLFQLIGNNLDRVEVEGEVNSSSYFYVSLFGAFCLLLSIVSISGLLGHSHVLSLLDHIELTHFFRTSTVDDLYKKLIMLGVVIGLLTRFPIVLMLTNRYTRVNIGQDFKLYSLVFLPVLSVLGAIKFVVPHMEYMGLKIMEGFSFSLGLLVLLLCFRLFNIRQSRIVSFTCAYLGVIWISLLSVNSASLMGGYFLVIQFIICSVFLILAEENDGASHEASELSRGHKIFNYFIWGCFICIFINAPLSLGNTGLLMTYSGLFESGVTGIALLTFSLCSSYYLIRKYDLVSYGQTETKNKVFVRREYVAVCFVWLVYCFFQSQIATSFSSYINKYNRGEAWIR